MEPSPSTTSAHQEVPSPRRPMTADTVRPVTGYFWSRGSDRLLYVQDKGGNENFHVWAVNPADPPEGEQQTHGEGEAHAQHRQVEVELEAADVLFDEALDARAADLSVAIGGLTSQIEETQQQLAMAEGDKALLQTELKRLMAEKAELERQLNDVTVLKAQISKLRRIISKSVSRHRNLDLVSNAPALEVAAPNVNTK